MSDRKTRIVLDDFSGGRNGADPPLGPTFADNQVTDAVNVNWYRTSGARKRNGSSNLSMTGSGFVGTVSWLGRHVPSTNEADAELWGVDEATPATFCRLDNSATWTTPGSVSGLPSPSGSNLWDLTCASLNGLFFISYESGTARLHVYEAATNSVRPTGMNPGTNAPTVANTGGGAYAATIRYYRVRFYQASNLRISEATPSVSFTPSGGGASARVTRPTAPGEGETAWYLEASADNVTFYRIGDTAIGTTTFDDSFAVANYSAGAFALSPLTGTYTLQKSYRFIAADGGRLIGFGVWPSTGKQNRIEYSAIIGSRDEGDAERLDTTGKYYDDLDENDSGVPTGLVGPVWGNFYPFKSRQMWELAPTGSVDRPYRLTAITKELGCVQGHACCRGEDANGNPCLYFMSHRGIYRYGAGGLTYIGRGIEDLILGPTSVMNMAATKVIAHMVYHPDLRQVWCWFATGSSNDPDTCVMFDVKANAGRGGWSRYTGSIATARCSVMFAKSIGATMGFSLVPYIGSTAAVNRVVRADDPAVTADAGTGIQATITTKPIRPGGAGFRGETGDLQLLAPVATGVTLTGTVTPDFGGQPVQSGTLLLTAQGSETRISSPNNRVQNTALSGAEFTQITLGDGSAASNAWSIDAVTIPLKKQEATS